LDQMTLSRPSTEYPPSNVNQADLKAHEREILIWIMYCQIQNGDGAKAAICYQALRETVAANDAPLAENTPALALYATALAMQSKLGVSPLQANALSILYRMLSFLQYDRTPLTESLHGFVYQLAHKGDPHKYPPGS